MHRWVGCPPVGQGVKAAGSKIARDDTLSACGRAGGLTRRSRKGLEGRGGGVNPDIEKHCEVRHSTKTLLVTQTTALLHENTQEGGEGGQIDTNIHIFYPGHAEVSGALSPGQFLGRSS